MVIVLSFKFVDFRLPDLVLLFKVNDLPQLSEVQDLKVTDLHLIRVDLLLLHLIRRRKVLY